MIKATFYTLVVERTPRPLPTRANPVSRKFFLLKAPRVAHYETNGVPTSFLDRKDWFVPHRRSGIHSFVVERLPDECRLDKIAPTLDVDARQQTAAQILSIILDLLVTGYGHRDVHGGNAFLVNGNVRLVDFESLGKYDGNLPSLSHCYDVTGEGMDSPWMTDRMCYNKKQRLAIGELLGVDFTTAKQALSKILIDELHQASLSFQTRINQRRHKCALGAIYNTIDLPDLKVGPSEAQRDCAKRFRKFGVSEENIAKKSVLDLGSNIGGTLFETLKYAPISALGIEYDAEKVHVSNRVAKFSDLESMQFVQADIDKLTLDDIGGTKDVVFCLAVDGHLKKKEHLYKYLADATNETLYFEGNSNSNIENVKERLLANGFSRVELLGMCDDDLRQENNNRPQLRAFK